MANKANLRICLTISIFLLAMAGLAQADTITEALAPLKVSDGGLYIGAEKMLEAGSFFSGLIDDVRIYNRALSTEDIEELAR